MMPKAEKQRRIAQAVALVRAGWTRKAASAKTGIHRTELSRFMNSSAFVQSERETRAAQAVQAIHKAAQARARDHQLAARQAVQADQIARAKLRNDKFFSRDGCQLFLAEFLNQLCIDAAVALRNQAGGAGGQVGRGDEALELILSVSAGYGHHPLLDCAAWVAQMETDVLATHLLQRAMRLAATSPADLAIKGMS